MEESPNRYVITPLPLGLERILVQLKMTLSILTINRVTLHVQIGEPLKRAIQEGSGSFWDISDPILLEGNDWFCSTAAQND